MTKIYIAIRDCSTLDYDLHYVFYHYLNSPRLYSDMYVNGDCKTSQSYENSLEEDWYLYLVQKYYWATDKINKVSSQSEVDKYFMIKELLR